MFNQPYNRLFNFNPSTRYDWLTGENSDNGNVFINPVGKVEDLSNVQILHKGVDTIKSLYNGAIKYSFGKECESLLETGEFNPVINIDGTDFILRPGSKASRYKFIMQAKALGVVILLGDYFTKDDNYLDEEKGKIKFEISPQLIIDNGLEGVDYLISGFNQIIMESFTPNGVEVHLCVDLQGWSPDDSIVSDMVTMTHRPPVMNYGIDSLDFNHQSSAVKYGNLQGVRWGGHSTSQLDIYCKSIESQVKGNKTFWHQVWSENIAYNPDKEVFRVELRIPSSVLKTLVKRDDGEPLMLLDIQSVSNYLNQIWIYGLTRLFRYDYSKQDKSDKYIKPIWQLLIDDVHFNHVFFPVDFKRSYIAVDDSIDKNITLLMGNLSSALAKAGATKDEFIETVQAMPLYSQLLAYARDKKDLSEEHYIQFLLDIYRKKLIEYNAKALFSKDTFERYRRNYKRNQHLIPGYASI